MNSIHCASSRGCSAAACLPTHTVPSPPRVRGPSAFIPSTGTDEGTVASLPLDVLALAARGGGRSGGFRTRHVVCRGPRFACGARPRLRLLEGEAAALQKRDQIVPPHVSDVASLVGQFAFPVDTVARHVSTEV